jgi:sarcosine oxidase subunit beta
MGFTEPGEPAGCVLQETDAWLEGLLAAAARRTPALATCGTRGGWSGLFEVTPDHNALIGEAQDVARFLYATGFSGHGFMQAPAVGEIVRDLYLGTEPFVDVSGLAAERFAGGRARPEAAIVCASSTIGSCARRCARCCSRARSTSAASASSARGGSGRSRPSRARRRR